MSQVEVRSSQLKLKAVGCDVVCSVAVHLRVEVREPEVAKLRFLSSERQIRLKVLDRMAVENRVGELDVALPYRVGACSRSLEVQVYSAADGIAVACQRLQFCQVGALRFHRETERTGICESPLLQAGAKIETDRGAGPQQPAVSQGKGSRREPHIRIQAAPMHGSLRSPRLTLEAKDRNRRIEEYR